MFALISDMIAPPAGGGGGLKMCPFIILQEMRLMRIQQTGEVDVQVDSAASVDLTKVLGEIREQYEAVVLKNKSELEKWFNTKVRNSKTTKNHKANFYMWQHVTGSFVYAFLFTKMENLRTQIITCTTEVKTYHTELSDLKRTYQSLEISRQGFYAEVAQAEVSLEG